MADEVSKFTFLIQQKPVCTQSPIKGFLGRERHRELRAKYKAELGIDLMDDRCDAVFTCRVAGIGCIGRPFPRDLEIKQALDSLNVVVSEGQHKGVDVYFAKALVDCSECPLKDNCDTPCASQESYVRRALKPDLSPKDHMLVSYDDYEAGKFGPVIDYTPRESDIEPDFSWQYEKLPLDCLSHQQREIVGRIIYKGQDQVRVSCEMNLDKSLVNRQYQASLDRMSEFGKARNLIEEHGASTRVKMYYIDCKTQQEIAEVEGVSKQSVNKSLSTWKELHT